jgi:hypothetical protein
MCSVSFPKKPRNCSSPLFPDWIAFRDPNAPLRRYGQAVPVPLQLLEPSDEATPFAPLPNLPLMNAVAAASS